MLALKEPSKRLGQRSMVALVIVVLCIPLGIVLIIVSLVDMSPAGLGFFI